MVSILLIMFTFILAQDLILVHSRGATGVRFQTSRIVRTLQRSARRGVSVVEVVVGRGVTWDETRHATRGSVV